MFVLSPTFLRHLNENDRPDGKTHKKNVGYARSREKEKVETQLPHLWNPHKIKKSDKMKLRYKISIWAILALAGSLLCGGSVWLWLAGICVGKLLIRLLLTIALAIAAYILAYALTIGAILWLLIS